MTDSLPVNLPTDQLPATTEVAFPAAAEAAPAAAGKKADTPSRLTQNLPTLEKLAALYPALFGAQFLPLKRGIFQDLLEAHPDTFEREVLKSALSVHTRSTRYLTVVASGLGRHDLQGTLVEAMAPEHTYQALLEVFRRRAGRGTSDVSSKLRQRMLQAFVDSCLSADAYLELVTGKDEEANALVREAVAQASELDAKDEATRRAFEASGNTVEAFADMYGLQPRAVAQALARARRFVVA